MKNEEHHRCEQSRRINKQKHLTNEEKHSSFAVLEVRYNFVKESKSRILLYIVYACIVKHFVDIFKSEFLGERLHRNQATIELNYKQWK